MSGEEYCEVDLQKHADLAKVITG